MNKMQCDVLVVGAGPAGLSTAMACVRQGLDTIIVEKSSVIGSSVKTSGHTYIQDVIENFNISRNAISQTINSFYLHSTSLDEGIEVNWDRNVLCTLNHYNFLQELATKAIINGAKVILPGEVVDVLIDREGIIKGAVIKTIRKKIEIEAKITIDASGSSAVIAKKIGLSNFKGKPIGFGIEYEMKNVKVKNPKRLEYYAGSEVVPIGYAWIAPKGKKKAAVGISTIIDNPTKEYEKFKSETGKDIFDCFEKFLMEHPIASHILKDAQPTEFHSGYSPLSGMSDRIYSDNLLIVGDAAGQTSPLLGEGIRFAMVFGSYAANIAAQAINSSKYSGDVLKGYEDMCKKYLGMNYHLALKSLNIKTDEYWDNVIQEIKNLIKKGDTELVLKYLRSEIDEKKDITKNKLHLI